MADAAYVLHSPEPGLTAAVLASFRRRRAALSAWSLILIGAAFIGCIAGVLFIRAPISLIAHDHIHGRGQHFYIVRHGDKYSSYPPCPAQEQGICFDKELMGDNDPLTPCGIEQAEYTAEWLLSSTAGGFTEATISHIVVSPFTRTLQTSLPLAKALDVRLHVEYFLSEARQPDGPFREFNINAPGETVNQLQECEEMWDMNYGSFPIKTPENDTLYVDRIAKAARLLKERFPPSSGNIAVFTHATPAFSIAYGLCYGDSGDDQKLKEFVTAQDAIGPAGVIHVIVQDDGSCTIEQTWNSLLQCGETPAYKCDFDDFPAWYWAHKDGKGPGRCS